MAYVFPKRKLKLKTFFSKHEIPRPKTPYRQTNKHLFEPILIFLTRKD